MTEQSTANMTVIVGLGFPRMPYLQNAKTCMNNPLNFAVSKNVNILVKLLKNLALQLKKQKNQVILSLLNHGE